MNEINQQDKKKINPKIIWVFVGMVLVSLYVGGLAYLKHQKNISRTVTADFIEFKNLPDDVIVKTTLKNKSGFYDLPFKNSTITLLQNAIDNFTVPYEVKTQIQTKDGDIKDIKWELDKDGVFYNITLDGFLPSEQLRLNINGNDATGAYVTDWNGRFLMKIVISQFIDTNICVLRKRSPGFEFCQYFPAQKARS